MTRSWVQISLGDLGLSDFPSWVYINVNCEKVKSELLGAAVALPESKHTEISEMGLGQKIKIEGVLAILVVGEK